LRVTFALAVLVSSLAVVQAGTQEADAVKALRRQAAELERQGQWDRACDLYDELLRLDRNQPRLRARYRHCLRRLYQVRRFQDPSYREDVLSLKYPQAVELYSLVVGSLLNNSLDRKRVGPGEVFRKGVEELRFALADPTFCQTFLADVPSETVQSFRTRLTAWADPGEMTRQQVKEQAREVAMAALQTLHLPPTTTLMEFTCGGCYAFDEYTVYLTPSQLRELYDSLRGKYVGVGIRLAAQDSRLVIAEVLPDSPAAELMPPLLKDDQIVSVDKKPTEGLSPEAVMELLEGDNGTMVEVVVYKPGMGTRMVTLQRRPLFVPSVIYHLKTPTIGYLQIACFQETTIQEIDTALLALNKAGMKALVLDLRGNTGGLVDSAIETARRFLPAGVIVRAENQDPRLNMVYQSHNPGALTLPLVVLVDGDTASAAEVLAGALKENKRARLVGQATFGKGCSQSVLKLPPGPAGASTGGLRITVSRLFSPNGHPYTGKGVLPHVLAPRRLTPDSLDDMDNQLAVAMRIAEEQR
jgi:carboxyl-terminal processing protease